MSYLLNNLSSSILFKTIESIYDLDFEGKDEERLRVYLTFYNRKTLYSLGGNPKLAEGGLVYFMINGYYPSKKFYSWKLIPSKVETCYLLLEGKYQGKITFGFAVKIVNLGIYLSNYNNRIIATNLTNLHQLYHTQKVKFLSNLEPIYNSYSKSIFN